MKTLDEIYTELENDNKSEIEKVWKEAKKESEKVKKINISICLIINIFIIIFICTNFKKFGFFILPMIIPVIIILNIIPIIIVNMLFSKNRNIYNEKYKEIVIRKIMSNFYNNLEYYPLKPMPEYIYNEGKYELYDVYNSEDYLEGQIENKYSIQMGEVLTQKKETYKDSNGETKTRLVTRFNGLFAKIIIDKDIIEELRIMENRTIYSRNKLEMDSTEFEKYFDVQASDKIKGMQILTADVMEELIEFENKTNMKFDIIINKQNLYLRFDSGEMFESGNIKKEILDKKLIEKYFYMINFTYNLSKKIIKVINEIEI